MHLLLHHYLRKLFCESLVEDDVTFVLSAAKEQAILNEEAARFALAAINMTHDRVRDIMTPSAQVASVNPEASLATIVDGILSSGFSRFPVIGRQDKVEGLLLLKDLFAALSQKASNDTVLDHAKPNRSLIHSLMQDALVVPESRKITGLLKEMRVKRKQAAIVVNEYGVFSGLVSIEDILEQIVGEIEDEHDSKTDNIVFDTQKNAFIVNAATEIEEFNKKFNTSIESDRFDTVGGMILTRLGRFPATQEALFEEHITIKVIEANDRRILKLLVISSKKLKKT